MQHMMCVSAAMHKVTLYVAVFTYLCVNDCAACSYYICAHLIVHTYMRACVTQHFASRPKSTLRK